MSSQLQAAMVGFDITPRIHPEFGAWGTTPIMTEVDLPLLGRCLALEHEGRRLIWFALDLCGNPPAETDGLRREIADAIGLTVEQVIWSTSQTHSSPALPGSAVPGGSSVTVRGTFDPAFSEAERARFAASCADAARQALDNLQPARVHAGRGHCDNVSYNTRFPMPAGGVKFSRNYGEGIQGKKYVDPTVDLVRFDDMQGKPIGVVFNFNCHPATMINDKYCSPDFVGPAREVIEAEVDGAPAMFVQGFCGDIHCYYMFCKPEQARLTGTRLGNAAVEGLRHMVPASAEPFRWVWRTITLPCQPMPTREELQHHIDIRRAFQDELDSYPEACWVGGVNVPEFMNVEERKAFVEVNIRYCEEGLRMIKAGETARSALDITLGALRIGDVYAALSPGENFALAGREIRARSPFPHTLICGDTNGLFGYIGNDEEIDRGGYETDTYWKMLYIDGFRTALATGAAQKVIHTCLELLKEVNV